MRTQSRDRILDTHIHNPPVRSRIVAESLLAPSFTAMLQIFKLPGVFRTPIVLVKRITARGQPRARRGGAVAESATDSLSLHFAPADYIQRKRWVSKHHSSQ